MKGKKLLTVLATSTLLITGCFNNNKKSSNNASSNGGDGSSEPAPSLPLADGAFSYVNSSNADRTEILGVLEKWAVENRLTGLTLYEDGGYVMYSPLVEKGAPNYIKGYGYGTLAEGNLTGDLAGEEEGKYKRYYHTYESTEPDHLIYMDYDSSLGELGYVAGGYYDIVMNDTRTGYKWVGDLARNDAPVAVDPAADGSSTKYRVPVKTGSALKYSTLTEKSELAAFNNREVQLEDYITPYKVYYTKYYGMRRNAEIKDANKGSIKGGDAYVAASEEGFNATAWESLGIKSGNNAELGDYIEFEFNAAYTPFWARYYISSSMFAPVPADFIRALGTGATDQAKFDSGVKLWGKFSEDTSYSPKDTYLCTGPYMTEEWVKNVKHTFKRNPNYVSGSDRATTRPSSYNIQGVYMSILKSLNDDREAALNEFLADKLHAVTVPSTRIKDFANDPRTTIVPGETTTKLNFNTCTPESWEELFGVNGTIKQTAKSDYWQLKPAMSNKNFLNGICYAFDRKTFAANLGATPSNDYFGSAYYSDAEEGIFYNDTDAHKRAVAKNLEGTDGYGYSLELAKNSFKLAAQEMLKNGDYEEGATIKIEIAWMVPSQKDTYFEPIKSMIMAAWNGANTGLNLDIEAWYADTALNVYYKKMMVGQFDIAYGGIEGNYYDPLNFMEVLKSDNSSTFTLNWGIPTNEKAELEWDGKLWTYDALWEVADHGSYVEKGKTVPTFDVKDLQVTRNAAGDVTLDLKLLTKSVENFKTELSSICIFGTTDGDEYSDYAELYLFVDGTIAFTKTGGYAQYVPVLYPDAAGSIEIGTEKDADGYVSLKVVLNAAFIDAFYNCVVDVFGGADEPFTDETQWYRLGFDFYKVITLFGVSSDPTVHSSLYINEGLPAIPAA